MVSMRAGLVYNPIDSGSIYTSYGSSLNPSVEGLSYRDFHFGHPDALTVAELARRCNGFPPSGPRQTSFLLC